MDLASDSCVEMLCAAMFRDGCVVLGNAVQNRVCEAVMRELEPYSQDVAGATVGSLAALNHTSRLTWVII